MLAIPDLWDQAHHTPVETAPIQIRDQPKAGPADHADQGASTADQKEEMLDNQ
jgi:hypothetical protein